MEPSKLWSSFIKRLPPARVLIGASLALASYFVTNIWKSNIDDEIRQYSALTDSASSLETTLGALSTFQATAQRWTEVTDLQKRQIVLLQQLTGTWRPEASQFLPSINIHEDRVISRQELLAQEFFSRLPEDVAALKATPNVPLLDPKRFMNATAKVEACITADVYSDPTTGAQYSEHFAKLYRDAAAKMPRLEDYPVTLRDAADSQLNRILVNQDAWLAINDVSPPADASQPNSAASMFTARRTWAIKCLGDARDSTFDVLAQLSRMLRQAVTERFINPRRATKRRIEMAEIALYFVSAGVALYGQARPNGGTDRAPADPPDPKPTRATNAAIRPTDREA